MTTEEAAVFDAIRTLDALLVRKDAAALDQLLLDDFVGTIPTGDCFSKAPYIAFHCRSGEGLTAIEPAPGAVPSVRILRGHLAVVNRRVAVQRRTSTGQTQAFEVQRIEVLMIRDGAWKFVSGQGTAVGPLPPR